MPKRPKNPRNARAAEKARKGQDLFAKLCELFRPHVEPLVRQNCLKELNGPAPTEEQVQALIAALRGHLENFGAAPEDIDEALREAESRIRNPATITPEEVDAAVDEAATEETAMLVMLWMTVLMYSSYQVANFHVLELAPLDDAMLPPDDHQPPGLFAQGAGQLLLGEQGVKDVLRAVKAALPAGEKIPAVAIELFEHEGLTVIK